MFKDFKLSDAFEKIDTPKIKAKANDFPTEYSDEYCVPLLTAGAENQGLNRYARRTDCPMIINNCISVSANGANSGICFFQPHDFAVLQDAYAVKVIGHDIQSIEEGLYLTGVLNKAIRDNHDWVNKAGWNNVKDDSIELPVIEKSNLDHEYTVDDIDWQYMRDRITELERDRITELDAYLQATGLNDYELTEEDKKVLSLSCKASSDEDGTLEDIGEDEVRFGEFELGGDKGLFDIYSPSKRFNANTIQFGGKYPYVARGSSNNGIRGYITEDEKYLSPAKSLSFGQDTATVFYQPNAYFTGDKIKVMVLKNHELTPELAEYFIAVIARAFSTFAWGQSSFNENIIKQMKISLPITSNGEPDFDYMERYIRAMEKVVIADVVRYKDKVIETTKKVVGE